MAPIAEEDRRVAEEVAAVAMRVEGSWDGRM
jgi:hypothetical protein